jgi:phospholipase/carboxylesterase
MPVRMAIYSQTFSIISPVRHGPPGPPGWFPVRTCMASSWPPSGLDEIKVEECDAEHDIQHPWWIDGHDIIFEPSGGPEAHQFTLVLLHSQSGGPDDWLPWILGLNTPYRNSVRIVVPCAPWRREGLGSCAYQQNSWFEYSEDGDHAQYPVQLHQQRDRIFNILEAERRRLPDPDRRRLVLGGFSQGVAMALDVALHTPAEVGGVFALRGAVLGSSLEELPAGCFKAFHLFAYHGMMDKTCPIKEVQAGYRRLVELCARVDFKSDPNLGHACKRGRQQLSGGELHHMSVFLRNLWQGCPF